MCIIMQYISVMVVPDQLMCFGGTEDLGNLGVEENKQISGIIFKFIREKLNIQGSRCVSPLYKVVVLHS